jgi:hypothetical protein
MMTKIGSIASLLALAMMSSPAIAGARDAAFASSGDGAPAQMSMFVGGNYRFSLDGRGNGRAGRATLKVAGAAQVPGSSQLRLGSGIELGGGADRRMALSIAGVDSRHLGKRMNLSSGATAGLVIGGLVLVGLAVAVASTEVPANAAFDD